MNFIKTILFGAFVITFVACEPIEKVGPEICPGEDFDFSKDDIHLFRVCGSSSTEIGESEVIKLDTSGLRIQVDLGSEYIWDLKITNGSLEKNYSGTDSEINILWYGQSDIFDGSNLSMPEGEISVELKVVCRDVISKKINLKGKQLFKDIDPSFGMLIRDYDQNGVDPVGGDSYSFFDGAPQWSTNNILSSNVVKYSNVDPSPAGGNYIAFEAEQNSINWYFGIYELQIKDAIATLPDVSTENVYLNFFVKRRFNINNIPANLGFNITGSNLMLANEEINWDGWKLISLRLSDLRHSLTEDPLTDVKSIEWLSVNLGAFPLKSSKTGLNYDMFLLTIDKPLFD
jgi:hypothetical protein